MHIFRRPPAPDTTARVTVRNGTAAPLLLIFEPWCWTDKLAPGAERVCEATSPRAGWLEVEYTSEAVTVYAWDACVARVYEVGGRLIESLDLRVPDFTAPSEQTRVTDRDPAG
jgi:hypothetical protein